MRDNRKDNLFLTTRPGAFAFRKVAGRYWFSLAPCRESAGYPLLVDFFDADFSVIHDGRHRKLMQSARGLAAIDYAAVRRAAPDDQTGRVSFEDTDEQESGFPNVEKLTLLAETTARLGSRFGLVVPSPEFLDADTESFVRYLVDAAKRTGFGLMWGTAGQDWQSAMGLPMAPLDADELLPPGSRDEAFVTLDDNHEAFSMLAESGAVLPVATFRAMGYMPPAGRAWPAQGFVLAPAKPSGNRARACKALAARMRPDGFDYLRRHPLLLQAEGGGELIRQHQIYRAGLSQVGREFLYRHYLAIAKAKEIHQEDALGAAYARLSAARLAPRVAVQNGFDLAVRHFRDALACPQLEALDRADASQQLANVYAVRGGSSEMKKAEQCYLDAEASLEGQGLSDRQLRIEIRILNGRALIEYKSGRPDAAEALENQALQVAVRYRGQYPAIHEWALSLIKTNLATLHLRAYNDLPACISLTGEVLSETEYLNDEQSTAQAVRLASLLAQDGQYEKAVGLLARTFDRTGGALGEVEVFATLLYASLLAQAGRGSEAVALIEEHSLSLNTVGADYARMVARQVTSLSKMTASMPLH